MRLKELEIKMNEAISKKDKAMLLLEYTGNKNLHDLLEKFNIPFDMYRKQKSKKDMEESKKALERRVAILSNHGISATPKTLKRLEQKGGDILDDFYTGYIMGDIKYLFINNYLFTSLNNEKSYSRNCKYKAQHGTIRVNMTLDELKKIQKIDGVWTILGKNGHAKWLEKHGKYGSTIIAWEHGYCIDNTHAKTMGELKRLLVLKRRATINNKDNNFFFGIDDLKRIGACNAGIKAAAEKLGIDTNKVGGLTIGYALELAAKKGNLETVQSWLKRI